MMRAPPSSDFASPSEDTTISKRDPLVAKGGKFCRHHDRGDVARARLILRAANIDAHTVEHRLDRIAP